MIDDRWRWTELEAVSGLGFRMGEEGPDGSLWFLGKDEVARYDGVSLERFPLGRVGEQLLQDLHVSRSGEVYVFSRRGLWRLEGAVWLMVLEIPREAVTNQVICEAENGDIWFAAGRHLYRLRGDEGEAFETDISSIYAMVMDRRGKVWAVEGGTGELSVYDVDSFGEGLVGPIHRFSELSGTFIGMNLFADSSGRVWVVNLEADRQCLVYEDYRLAKEIEEFSGLGFSDELVKVAEAPAGRFWFSVRRRLAELRGDSIDVHEVENYPLPTSYAYVVSLSGDRLLIGGKESKNYIVNLSNERWTSYRDLNFQCQDQSGTRWFLEHEGKLVSQDGESGEWMAYDQEDGIVDTPNRVFYSSDGTLWVSGKHGEAAAVSFLDKGVWKRIEYPDAGLIFSHLGVVEASDGSVVFGAGTPPPLLEDRSGGAVVFRRVAGALRGSQVTPPIFPDRTASIVERRDDGFWFGAASLTRRLGSGMLAPERVDFLQDHWIDHLSVDADNDLWAALWGSGVYQYDGKEWFHHGEANGLGSDQVIYLLHGNRDQGMLAATEKGLSRYDGRSWTNWDFPLQSRFKRENHTLYYDGDGSLWINYAYRSWLLDGKSRKARRDSFRTVRYRKSDLGPQTEIVAFDERLPEGSPVLFKWTGADMWSETPKGELEFSWRIGEGDWSAFSRDTSAVLDRFEAGSYVFEVRARDRDWNVDATPARASFEVFPPLWKRPWFILLMLATLGVIFALASALLKARVRAAIAMEEFKLDFFTNISHELKNPLAVIIGPLESILRKERSYDIRHNLQLALRNARKMQGLVNQLLQFRKLELGKASYRPTPGELIGFLREAVEAHAPLWTEKGQTVRVETNPAYCICGYDADKFQKIVDNLLSNSIKYTPEGGSISVSLDVASADGHSEAYLIIDDDGIGIPKHEIELVLKPFYRVNGDQRKTDGFGIGLALVGQLVQLWGGELSIESPPAGLERGTRVAVRLPLAESVHLEDEDLDEEVPPPGHESANGHRAKVLLVEDNVDLRRFMKDELSEHYDVLEAGDGKSGLEVADKLDPDLVITDVTMPEMDGLEMCRRLRANSETSHIPVIILTAKSSEEHSVEGAEAGADAYFAKPLNLVRLLAQAENLLETRRNLKRLFAEQLVIEPTELTVNSSDEAILRKAIAIVDANMADEDFDVDHFAKEMAMSRATLYRKLKALTGQAPNPFIRTMRLKRAAQLLKTGNVSVSEALEHIGILDLSYFSRVFKKEFGVAPSAYGAE